MYQFICKNNKFKTIGNNEQQQYINNTWNNHYISNNDDSLGIPKQYNQQSERYNQ